jgi:hypothetical protein
MKEMYKDISGCWGLMKKGIQWGTGFGYQTQLK